jgi:excisionase family DNA binding protein
MRITETTPESHNPVEGITSAEAAQLADYHVKYIRRLVKEGKIAGVKRGRDWWIDKASVEAYVNEMKQLGSAKHDPWRMRARQKGDGTE